MSLQCDKILVQPPPVLGFLDSFQLSNPPDLETSNNETTVSDQVDVVR